MHPDAELLSGYLDGELTPAERAVVEQLLAKDAKAGELLADLRGIRTDLQQVPKVQLPEQFANEVLRSAERLMLLGPAELTPSAQAEIDSAQSELAPRAARRHLWSSPAWFITGAAVAVLLMFALGPWRGGPGRQIAQRPSPPSDVVAAKNGEGAAGSTSPDVAGTATQGQPIVERTARRDASVETVTNVTNGDADVAPVSPTHDSPAVAELSPDATGGERKRDPFGTIISCEVDRKAIANGAVDQLLALHQIVLVGKSRDGGEIEQLVEDVVYVEATPEQLAKVLEDMAKEPNTFKSPVMQMTLGVFRDPALWSEMLDADAENDGAAHDEAVAASKGARAVHFKPSPNQAKALVIEEPTQDQLLAMGALLAGQAPPDGGANGNQQPKVDNGLVRAVFILHVTP
ncbi:MAG: zf-HC2 domain-containing protein [Planctomycetia bacterium]|nr:zf-HC2 domain-containing protein [Planctomycetia bacterium]